MSMIRGYCYECGGYPDKEAVCDNPDCDDYNETVCATHHGCEEITTSLEAWTEYSDPGDEG